ncbi:MAG: septum formation protein Maf [Methylobacter sp.]|nr:MAG: septum formation protein Maf [Methylobacter sp.]
MDESPKTGETALAYVERIAAEKSAACCDLYGRHLPVLAADTSVVINHLILGKPVDFEAAHWMLTQLSGQTHEVYTSVSLRGREHWQATSITQVTFRPLDSQEIEAYWRTGEPLGKAGGYAIQGLGSAFVQSITGSFSGVMGLPLFETAQLLAKQGINLFQ